MTKNHSWWCDILVGPAACPPQMLSQELESVEHCKRVANGICALLHAHDCPGCELDGCAGARALWQHLNLCEGCSSPVCTKAKSLLRHYETCASRKRLRDGSEEGSDTSSADAPDAPICLVCALVERERATTSASSSRTTAAKRLRKRVRFADRVEEHVFCDCRRACDCRECDTRPHRDVRRRLIPGF